MSSQTLHRVVLGGLVGLLASLLGCRPATSETAVGRPRVVVSVAPQAWLVRQLAGPEAEILTLVKPVDNHHTYQPTDAQVSRVMQADVYFRIGLPFENGPWFQALKNSGRLSIVDTRQGVPLQPMEEHGHAGEAHAGEVEHEGFDPHIWLSPPLLKIQARTVADALTRVDPDRKAEYAQNLQRLEQQLDQLDGELRAMLEPVRGKAFFVFHPAWGYFAAEYQLRQVAIESEGKQPTDAELTAVQQEAKQAGVKAIFVQPQIAGQAAAAVASAIGARLETLDPLAEDVPGCLRQAATRIAQSYQEKPE